VEGGEEERRGDRRRREMMGVSVLELPKYSLRLKQQKYIVLVL
jgi:hypothetical protein